MLGRFLTPDPLAGSIANPQSLNRYAYVGNDPVNFIDPLGLTHCTLVCSQTCWVDDTGRRHCTDNGCTLRCPGSPPELITARRRILYPLDPPWEALEVDPAPGGGGPLDLHLRQPGESVLECAQRVQEALLGKTGAAILNITALVSPGILSTAIAQVAVPFPLPSKLSPYMSFMYGTGQAVWTATPLEALAIEGFGGRGLALAQSASSAISKVAAPVTAVSTGIALAFILDCL